MTVFMASLNEEGVEEQQLADTSDAVDGVVFNEYVSSIRVMEEVASIPVTSETLSGASAKASAVW